jgi:hypothetical protein
MGYSCRAALGGALALAALGLFVPPAPAQFRIAPDRSTVILPPPRSFPLGGQLMVTPVVVPPYNKTVRLNTNFSGMSYNFTQGYPGTGFQYPFYANDRAKGANFNGVPQTTFANPFVPWW